MKKFNSLLKVGKSVALSVPSLLIIFLHMKARRNDVKIRLQNGKVKISKGNNSLLLDANNIVYSLDLINNFEYYFGAVRSENAEGENIVDYSRPGYHDVIGFERFPIFFASISEPVETTNLYLDFAQLKHGDNVVDLGAYSGLTSIIFKEKVGDGGRVVAVDADRRNFAAIDINLKNYFEHTGQNIESLFGAIWNHSDGLEFSSEGCMGSSASSIVGAGRGELTRVPSYSLSDVANKFSLEKIDFLKVDVEGAEAVIFEDKNFFDKFRPRIIIEPHFVDGVETSQKCIQDLSGYGYTCKRTAQVGSNLPLLECAPQ